MKKAVKKLFPENNCPKGTKKTRNIRAFSEITLAAGLAHDWFVSIQSPSLKKTTCMDAGGRAPTIGALGDAEAVAAGLGEILLDKSPFFKGGSQSANLF